MSPVNLLGGEDEWAAGRGRRVRRRREEGDEGGCR